ncbi:2Fe-2S iron-sulfur cluster-binding protein [Singulisphaera sp. Ch08]|uniref:2Fe-2S iron-sulfur cluster-binding protein n=1 Tax=Singulisphaera sp. Ch08 TaxID=3120278 RepID=A0AAU7CRC6_9BACT
MLELKVNGKLYRVDVSPDTPLLCVLRETLGLTGTRFGCGMALCGVCTVHLDGEAIRSCITPVSRAVGKEVVTVEGVSDDRGSSQQEAWIADDGPRCGACQLRQVLAVASPPSKDALSLQLGSEESRTGNICRCGTDPQIQQATPRVAATTLGDRMKESGEA